MRMLYIIYKTRWIIILFLFYIVGLWLEGPPIRILVRSDIFMFTFILLSLYSSIYLVFKFPKYKKIVIFINTCITVFFLVFVRVRYNGAILKDTDIVFYLLLFLIFLQLAILGKKLLYKKDYLSL